MFLFYLKKSSRRYIESVFVVANLESRITTKNLNCVCVCKKEEEWL